MSWSDERLADLLRALPPAPERLVAQAEELPDFLPDATLEVDPQADAGLLDDAGTIGPATGDTDLDPVDRPDSADADDDGGDGGWLHQG